MKIETSPTTLAEVKANDFGCQKDDAEFTARSNDLIVGADAPQLQELVEALADFCQIRIL